MAKKLIVFLILITSSICSFGQFDADSVFIYKDFTIVGSTARLIHNHHMLDSLNSPKVKLDLTKLNELKELFESERKSKYFQQKHGGEVYYLIVWLDNMKYFYVAETSEEFGRIVNLTDMKQLKLSDSEKAEKLDKLISKNLL